MRLRQYWLRFLMTSSEKRMWIMCPSLLFRTSQQPSVPSTIVSFWIIAVGIERGQHCSKLVLFLSQWPVSLGLNLGQDVLLLPNCWVPWGLVLFSLPFNIYTKPLSKVIHLNLHPHEIDSAANILSKCLEAGWGTTGFDSILLRPSGFGFWDLGIYHLWSWMRLHCPRQDPAYNLDVLLDSWL